LTLLLVALVASGWLAGPRIVDQIAQLTERIPDAIESIQSGLVQYEWIQKLLSSTPQPQQILPLGSEVLDSITGAFSAAVGYVSSVPVVLFLGVYLAASPHLYIDGAIHLLPLAKRKRAREVFSALGQALRWWLVGRIASMAVVGALTVLGLSIVGVSLALTLGLIAALLSFVPYVGPVLSAIPAILVALVESPRKVIHVAFVYGAVQALESYLITPLIQHRAVSIPPALLLIAQILMGVLAGPVGVLLATPLAVVVIVIVQMLYVQDVLGDCVKVLGE
jgi:predicted PurR-regulated permease PerM